MNIKELKEFYEIEIESHKKNLSQSKFLSREEKMWYWYAISYMEWKLKAITDFIWISDN